MKFDIQHAICILEKTPMVLRTMLSNLDSTWTHTNEGGDSWSPYDVIGHLVHGEKADWMPRLEIMLQNGSVQTFEPYDRFAQIEMSKGKSLAELLDAFELLRKENLNTLRSKNISEVDLMRKAIHPSLGKITLAQMLSAWVVHDQGHIAQVSRVLAKNYTEAVGPWTKYLTILNYTPQE